MSRKDEDEDELICLFIQQILWIKAKYIHIYTGILINETTFCLVRVYMTITNSESVFLRNIIKWSASIFNQGQMFMASDNLSEILINFFEIVIKTFISSGLREELQKSLAFTDYNSSDEN